MISIPDLKSITFNAVFIFVFQLAETRHAYRISLKSHKSQVINRQDCYLVLAHNTFKREMANQIPVFWYQPRAVE